MEEEERRSWRRMLCLNNREHSAPDRNKLCSRGVGGQPDGFGKRREGMNCPSTNRVIAQPHLAFVHHQQPKPPSESWQLKLLLISSAFRSFLCASDKEPRRAADSCYFEGLASSRLQLQVYTVLVIIQDSRTLKDFERFTSSE